VESSSGAPREPSRLPTPHAGAGREDAAVDLLTINEVAAALRVSKMTVYRLIRAGQLPAIQVGKSFRVHHGDLAAYLSATAVQPAPDDNSGAGPESDRYRQRRP